MHAGLASHDGGKNYHKDFTQVKQIAFVLLFNPSTPAFQRKNMHMLFGKGLER